MATTEPAPVSASGPSARRPIPGNDFGLLEAILGLVVGFLVASAGSALYLSITSTPVAAASRVHPLGSTVVDLVGLWVGLVGAAVLASRAVLRPVLSGPTGPGTGPPAGGAPTVDVTATNPELGRPTSSLVRDFGVAIHPWPDIPLGIVVGVASQYLLVPLLELPLLPFVPHLFHRLSGPANNLTNHVHGPGLIVLALLVCVGSPAVEELFFRGLLLRALLGRFSGAPARLGPLAAILLTGAIFGLAHFEALQFLALAGFGVVLCVLAWRTGRLGASFVAHMSFNAVTIVAIAVVR